MKGKKRERRKREETNPSRNSHDYPFTFTESMIVFDLFTQPQTQAPLA